jgi:hypothetical protein
MNLLCVIGFHAWSGCTCLRCGKTRNNNHHWDACICDVCGKMRDKNHIWKDGKCIKCGKTIRFNDNLGTLIKTGDEAFASWQPYLMNNYTGSLVFKFPNLESAKNALSKLSFIHFAVDENELVASEIIEYGYYKDHGVFYAVIWGPSFTIEMFNEAKKTLKNAGGVLFKSQKPTKTQKTDEFEMDDDDDEVTFVRNEQMGNAYYEIYSGKSKKSALAFLGNNPVNESFFYRIVETPEGNYGRDINGVYQE